MESLPLFIGSSAIVAAFAGVGYVLASHFKNVFFREIEIDNLATAMRKKENILIQISKSLAQYLRREKSHNFQAQADELNQRLMEAGGFWGAEDGYDIIAVRYVLAGLLATVLWVLLAVLFSSYLLPVLAALPVAALGYVYPTSILNDQAKRRQKVFFKQFPGALDMFCACSDAGLEFSRTMDYVVSSFVEGPVKEELSLAQADLRLGRSMDEALNRLISRINVQEVTSIVGGIAQALEMGSPIARILRESAKEMRKKRALAAENDAKKAVVKMTFPLLLLVMPGVFIVLLGPVVIDLMATFAEL